MWDLSTWIIVFIVVFFFGKILWGGIIGNILSLWLWGGFTVYSIIFLLFYNGILN